MSKITDIVAGKTECSNCHRKFYDCQCDEVAEITNREYDGLVRIVEGLTEMVDKLQKQIDGHRKYHPDNSNL